MQAQHPHQLFRYGTVRSALMDELGLAKGCAEHILRHRLPDHPHHLHAQKLWLAKDVNAFIVRVQAGETDLLK